MFAHHLGGRGRGALHTPGAAPDRAALQAGGEGRSECLSVPEEILLSRAGVRTPSLPFTGTLSKILKHF